VRRRLLISVAVLGLAIPGFALANGKPSSPSTTTKVTTTNVTTTNVTTNTTTTNSRSNAAPKVMFVLKGTITNYVPANGATDGTITLTVKHANRHGANLSAYLKNSSLTFTVSSATKIVLHVSAAVADGDNVIVKVRGPKAAAAFAVAAPTLKAFQVLDQGAPAG
jgi:hypothetical protein